MAIGLGKRFKCGAGRFRRKLGANGGRASVP